MYSQNRQTIASAHGQEPATRNLAVPDNSKLDYAPVPFKGDAGTAFFLQTINLQEYRGLDIWLLKKQVTDVQLPLLDFDS